MLRSRVFVFCSFCIIRNKDICIFVEEALLGEEHRPDSRGRRKSNLPGREQKRSRCNECKPKRMTGRRVREMVN